MGILGQIQDVTNVGTKCGPESTETSGLWFPIREMCQVHISARAPRQNDDISESVHSNCDIVSEIRPLLLLTVFFTNHCSMIIIPSVGTASSIKSHSMEQSPS